MKHKCSIFGFNSKMSRINPPEKVILFAPFWRRTGHVGNLRMDRFVRWLAEEGFYIVIIRAGTVDGEHAEPWGVEITIRDPMNLYRDVAPNGVPQNLRRPNKLRRSLSYWLFMPDPSVVWARFAASHPLVLAATKGASLILSSSPPESAHLGAWKLSQRCGIPHIVDMRDGWIDEPLKPFLVTSPIRRWREARLEANILLHASAIFVTSEVWRDLLCKRLPKVFTKVAVLTNGYPKNPLNNSHQVKERSSDSIVLIHAGRFTGSSLSRTPDLLLLPLLKGVRQHHTEGTIKLFGSLSADDKNVIDRYALSFGQHGWQIECPGVIPHNELLQVISKADGLLLLSASFAAVPSKLFEYIPTKNPILVVTKSNSATWRICKKLTQAVLIEYGKEVDVDCIFEYLKMVKTRCYVSSLPDDYTEETLKRIFYDDMIKIHKR